MPVSSKIELVGVKEALRELNQIDRKLANKLKADARKVMKPVVDDARSAIPNVALSGMSRSWTSAKSGAQLLPWEGDTARSYVKAKTSTKKPKEFNGNVRDLAAFYVSWAGGVNMLFDMAGRSNKSPMAANLTTKFGPPSRIMWPAYEENETKVTEGITKVVDDIVQATNETLLRRIR